MLVQSECNVIACNNIWNKIKKKKLLLFILLIRFFLFVTAQQHRIVVDSDESWRYLR